MQSTNFSLKAKLRFLNRVEHLFIGDFLDLKMLGSNAMIVMCRYCVNFGVFKFRKFYLFHCHNLE